MRSSFAVIMLSLLMILPETLMGQLEVPEGRRIREVVETNYPDGILLMGATTGSWAFGGSVARLMDREYSYVTPENDFKQSVIRADPNAWNWSRADAWLQHIVDNGQVLRMHGPISPQCSRWAKEDDRTAVELAEELDTFMTALCMRYNGVPGIEYLDVVNEIALDDGSWFGPKGGTDSWENPWTRIGYDNDPAKTPLYISQAFTIANEHAPDLKLMLNNHCKPGTAGMEKVKQCILYLRDLGYRVDAMGWQAHVDVGWETEQNLQALADVIDWCQEREIEFHITEFDAYIEGEYYPTFEMQASTYKAILDVMLERNDSIVMGWNAWHISDASGWKTEKRPAAFDDNYLAKPAYYAMQLALETQGDYSTPFQVSFELLEEESGLPLEGCTMEMNGEKLVTGADGMVQFQPMTAERYEISAKAAHRDTIEKIVSIYSDTLITLDLKQAMYDVAFLMKDNYTGNPLPWVLVSMNGEEVSTNLAGIAEFMVPVGNYLASFSGEGYEDFSQDFRVDRNSSFELSISRTHASVKFRLKSGSAPLNKALVELGEESQTTSSLGLCTFSGQEIGQEYNWQVSREDYFSLSGSFTLNTDTTINLQLRNSLATLTMELDEASMDAESAFSVVEGDTAWFSGEGICKFYKLPVDMNYNYKVGSDNYNELLGSVLLEGDSTLSISLIVDGIGESFLSSPAPVWPVPATDVLYVSDKEGYISTEIFDLTGSLVLKTGLEDINHSISLNSFQRGCYLIRLRNSGGETSVYRFLVQY